MEHEVKITFLNHRDVGKVANLLGDVIMVRKYTDTYWDTPEMDLDQSKESLRIRNFADGSCILSYKTKCLVEIPINGVLPTNLNLSLIPKDSLLEQLGTSRLISLGSLRTIRTTYNWNNHDIEIDTVYSTDGRTLFELGAKTLNCPVDLGSILKGTSHFKSTRNKLSWLLAR